MRSNLNLKSIDSWHAVFANIPSKSSRISILVALSVYDRITIRLGLIFKADDRAICSLLGLGNGRPLNLTVIHELLVDGTVFISFSPIILRLVSALYWVETGVGRLLKGNEKRT